MAALPRSCPFAHLPARPWRLAAQVTQVTIVIPVRFVAGLHRRIFANTAQLHFCPHAGTSWLIAIQ
jgi:hypothetical protein